LTEHDDRKTSNLESESNDTRRDSAPAGNGNRTLKETVAHEFRKGFAITKPE